MRGSVLERFEAKYIPEPNSGCWLWVGARGAGGYGCFHLDEDRGIKLAHRCSWLLHRGHMPEPSIKVCHSCDNKLCVNPEHLWLGSQRDNMRDCFAKGRMEGRPHPRSTAMFTDDEVREILKSKEKHRELAQRYSCAESTISMIKSRRHYKHVL